MKKVFIGVGHGGSDPGATANGMKEKDINLQVALSVYKELGRHGVDVLLSRSKDENDPVADEVNECNKFKPDLAIDIHTNAGGGDGCEAFYHYKGGLSKTLADNVLSEIVSIGQNSRGAKTKRNILGKDYYKFIRETTAPAVIVEVAFIDNKQDITIVDELKEQQAMGVAIAKGILKTLGITYVAEAKQETSQKKIYRVQVGSYSVKANAEKMKQQLKSAGYSAIIVEV